MMHLNLGMIGKMVINGTGFTLSDKKVAHSTLINFGLMLQTSARKY